MHQTSPASPLAIPICFAVLPTPSECYRRRLGLFTASVRQLIVCTPQLYFSRHLNLVVLEIRGFLGMFSSKFSSIRMYLIRPGLFFFYRMSDLDVFTVLSHFIHSNSNSNNSFLFYDAIKSNLFLSKDKGVIDIPFDNQSGV